MTQTTYCLRNRSRSELLHDLVTQKLVVRVLAVLHFVAIRRQQPLERLSDDQKCDRIVERLVQVVDVRPRESFSGQVER